MRIRWIAMLAVVLVAGPSLAIATDPDRPAGTLHLDIKEVTTQFYFGESVVYPKPPGRGAGNQIYFTGELSHWEGGAPLGVNRGFCLTVSDQLTRVQNPEGPGIGTPVPTPAAPPQSIAQCQQTLELIDGTITLQGLLDQFAFEGDCAQRAQEQFCSGEPSTLAVTGGTGSYAGAYGEATLLQVEYPDVVRITMDLVVPGGANPPLSHGPFDTRRPVWIEGAPGVAFIRQLTAVEEGTPEATIYLTAWSGDAPQDDGTDAPPFIYVPPHDDIIPAGLTGYANRRNAFGYALVPGPAATDESVLRRDTSSARAGRPSPFPDVMAYAVVMDGKTTPLRTMATAERAIEAGLVKRVPLQDPFSGAPSPYGGVVWTAP